MPYGDNIFTGIIDNDGTIFEAGTGRKRQAVGVDIQREQELQSQITEMQEIIDNYYNKLVELGEIKPPKTPEQIAQESAAQQAEINQKLLEAINSLQSELGVLKNGNVGNGSQLSINSIEQDSTSDRKKSPGRPKGNKTSTENVTRDT